jgi:hypothetical protein
VSFDAKAHISNIRGKDYLEVKWRIVWFREEHPAEEGWGIVTKPLKIEEALAVYRAEVVDPEGRVIATGTKSETPKGFEDFIEKAETGSIGRALALLGYGTQWCADELAEGERIVDSPVQAAPATPPGLDENGNPLNLVGLANAMAIDGTPKKFVKPAAALCEFDWDERENYTPEQLQAIRIEAHSMWQIEQGEQQEAVA